MIHLSDSDEPYLDETVNFHNENSESNMFGTLPDELVLKIIKMAFNNLGKEFEASKNIYREWGNLRL